MLFTAPAYLIHPLTHPLTHPISHLSLTSSYTRKQIEDMLVSAPAYGGNFFVGPRTKGPTPSSHPSQSPGANANTAINQLPSIGEGAATAGGGGGGVTTAGGGGAGGGTAASNGGTAAGTAGGGGAGAVMREDPMNPRRGVQVRRLALVSLLH